MGLVQEAPSFSHGQKVWKSTSVLIQHEGSGQQMIKCKHRQKQVTSYIYIYTYSFLFDPSSAICNDLVDDGRTKKTVFWEMPTMFACIPQIADCWRKLKRWNTSSLSLVTSLKCCLHVSNATEFTRNLECLRWAMAATWLILSSPSSKWFCVDDGSVFPSVQWQTCSYNDDRIRQTLVGKILHRSPCGNKYRSLSELSNFEMLSLGQSVDLCSSILHILYFAQEEFRFLDFRWSVNQRCRLQTSKLHRCFPCLRLEKSSRHQIGAGEVQAGHTAGTH